MTSSHEPPGEDDLAGGLVRFSLVRVLETQPSAAASLHNLDAPGGGKDPAVFYLGLRVLMRATGHPRHPGHPRTQSPQGSDPL